MEYGNTFDAERPQQKSFALILCDDTAKGAEHGFRTSAKTAAMARIVTSTQGDIEYLVPCRGTKTERRLIAYVWTAGPRNYPPAAL